MENSTQNPQSVHQDSSMLPESTVLLNSAAEAGNWDLVQDVIRHGEATATDVSQSVILQKLASATGISQKLVRNILNSLFSNRSSGDTLKHVVQEAFLRAAHCDNWDTMISFLSAAYTLFEDEASLLSVTEMMGSSKSLRKNRYLQIDVLACVWRHAKRNILDSADKRVQNTLVQLAAELNMWSRVCDLLVSKPDLNLLDRDGLSVLHRLVMCPDSRFDSLLPVLLKNGADVNLKNSEGNTALHLAAKHQTMVTLGKSLNVVDSETSPQCQNLKMQIIDNYRRKRAESKCHALTTLIDSCNYIDECDHQGNTAAMIAAKNDNWEFLVLLLKHGARVGPPDQSQRSVLHICALRGSSLDHVTCETIVNLCVNKGAGIDDRDAEGRTALHLAVESHSWTVFKSLVKLGADFMCRDRTGYNVLHKMAQAESGHSQDVTSLFSLLVERGADLNAISPEGDAVVHIATRLQNWTLVNHLVYLGADINLCNSEGFAVLHILALSKPLFHEKAPWNQKNLCKNYTIVQSLLDFLLQKGMDLELRCSTTETALHLAARHENWFMVKYLVQRGANILELDIEGCSILQRLICCRSEIRDMEIFLSILRHNGGRSSLPPIAGGNSLLQLAAKHEKWEIADYILKDKGGNVDQLDNEGYSVLHRMATSRGRTFKEGLWCFSIRPIFHNSTNLDEQTRHDLIHQAAAAGNVDVVDALLDNFDDVNRADCEGFTVLHRVAQCCVSTSVAIIRRIVQKGADVDKKCPDGNTALHLAAKSNNWLAVQHLLKYGASANTLDTEGMTVLHRLLGQPHLRCRQCAQRPYSEITVLLLTDILFQGALINQRDLKDNTPLHLAVKNEHWDMVIELLARGASMNERDSCGCTALHTIAKRRKKDINNKISIDSSCVTCSINGGSNIQMFKSNTSSEDSIYLVMCDYFVNNTMLIDVLDPDGNTALMLSVKNNNWDITERLLLKGANICILDRKGVSVLHVLASATPECGSDLLRQQLSKKILDLLISNSADINARDPEGNTPLQLAAKHGNMDMVENLLEFLDDVNETDSEGFTLLSRVAQTLSPKCEDITIWLLENGADVDFACPDGKTPLVLSVISKNWMMTSLLLDFDANIDSLFLKEHLIVHRLLEDSRLKENCEIESEILMRVIELGNDTFLHRSPDGRSPIQHAFMKRKWNIVEMLLENGAYTDPEPLLGEFVFHDFADWASESQMEDEDWILSLLPSGSLNINLRDSNGDTPLNILAQNGQWQLVQWFVEHGASVNVADSKGWTVLHRLAMMDFFSGGEGFRPARVLKSIVEKGADINAAGPEGKTAVQVAKEKKNWIIFWSLVQLGAEYNWDDADKQVILENVCHFKKRGAQADNLEAVIRCLTDPFSNLTRLQTPESPPLLLNALEKCVQYSNWTVAKVLLHYCPNLSFKSSVKNSYLLDTMVSSYRKKEHVIWVSFLDTLIERGLDINSRGRSGQPVLFHWKVLIGFIYKNQNSFLKVLLQRGADPWALDIEGHSFLTKVLRESGTFVLKAFISLIQLGVIPQEKYLKNVAASASPTRTAVHKKDWSVLKILTKCGASTNSELFALHTEYQLKRAQDAERERSMPDQVGLILEQTATHPSSLESLCRLAVSRCLPCGLGRNDSVRSLCLPSVLQDYLLFIDVLSDPELSSIVIKNNSDDSSDADDLDDDSDEAYLSD